MEVEQDEEGADPRQTSFLLHCSFWLTHFISRAASLYCPTSWKSESAVSFGLWSCAQRCCAAVPSCSAVKRDLLLGSSADRDGLSQMTLCCCVCSLEKPLPLPFLFTRLWSQHGSESWQPWACISRLLSNMELLLRSDALASKCRRQKCRLRQERGRPTLQLKWWQCEDFSLETCKGKGRAVWRANGIWSKVKSCFDTVMEGRLQRTLLEPDVQPFPKGGKRSHPPSCCGKGRLPEPFELPTTRRGRSLEKSGLPR